MELDWCSDKSLSNFEKFNENSIISNEKKKEHNQLNVDYSNNNLNFDDCFLNFINYNGVYSSLRYFFLDIANDVLFLDFNKELNQLHDSLSTKIDFINYIQTSRTNQKNSSCMKSQASEALKATPKIQISFEKTLNPITS
jgi:hypothetical protein